jgi:DNA-binding MarR family transcriptional regulator
MNELASRILFSKRGLTRVVDRMEEAGVRRGAPSRRPTRRQRPHLYRHG